MKPKMIIACAALSLAAPIFTACSDDKNDAPALSAEKVYSGKSLDLEYSGEEMDGKSVKVTRNGETATLTLYSTLDLAAVPGAGIINSVQGPGVIPGEPNAMLQVNLVASGGKYTFSGTQEGTYCSYSYSGRLDDSSLSLDIDNVVLKDKTLADTEWTPQPYIPSTQGLGAPLSSPLSLTWTSSEAIDLGNGMELDTQQVADMLANVPLIYDKATGENASLAQLIARYVKSISFGADGNVSAIYNTVEGGNRLDTETTPVNTLQYVLPGSNRLLLFVDFRSIITDILDETRAQVSTSTLLSTIESLLNVVQPQLSQGFPFAYSSDGSKMTLSLPQEVATPAVKQIISSLLSDKEVAQALLQKIADNPAAAEYLPVIQNVIASLPKVVEATGSITLTLNLVRVQ
ncbi:MAG: DUF4925 domain-containing protein [Bacteroidales bacterium]|nr:DUF4925 domain-containing protein [Bacteroidales bacterium]MBD5221675.1 DUF4925 domain-containing protein [Bacteroidales bacterium]